MTEPERDPIAEVLASAPPSEVRADFLARVNARIDADAADGWFDLLDFRAWTFRLAPIAAALGLIVVLWPGPSSPVTTGTDSTMASDGFRLAAQADWQKDVSADALLEAALIGGNSGR